MLSADVIGVHLRSVKQVAIILVKERRTCQIFRANFLTSQRRVTRFLTFKRTLQLFHALAHGEEETALKILHSPLVEDVVQLDSTEGRVLCLSVMLGHVQICELLLVFSTEVVASSPYQGSNSP